MSHFFEHYWEIVSDPAHLAAELTFMLIIDILVLGLFWPLAKRFINNRIHHVHQQLDEEHGIVHDPVTGEAQRKEVK